MKKMSMSEVIDYLCTKYGISRYRADLLADSLLAGKTYLSERQLVRKLRKVAQPSRRKRQIRFLRAWKRG
jgi:hypothetical protein